MTASIGDIMTNAKKYENMTPLERARVANSDEKAFRALKRDHQARLDALYAKLPKCTTRAEHAQTMESIQALLRIPTSSAA